MNRQDKSQTEMEELASSDNKRCTLKEYRDSLEQTASSTQVVGTGGVLVKDLLSDLPEAYQELGLIAPLGFHLSDDGIAPASETTMTPRIQIHAPIIVTGKIRDSAIGQITYDVAWKRGNDWQKREFRSEDLSDSRRIVGLSKYDFPVTSDDSKVLVRYIKQFLAENTIPEVVCSSRLGWQDPQCKQFLLGAESIQAPGIEPIHFNHANTDAGHILNWLDSSGTLDEWKQLVSNPGVSDKAILAVLASLASPLLQILGAPPFLVDLYGESGSGKSTALHLAGSVWGKVGNNGLVSCWDATSVGLEQTAEMLNGLPVLLDETQAARSPTFVKDTIYRLVNGQGRTRGTVNGVSTRGGWSSIAITTGERAAVSFSHDIGTRNRSIPVPAEPFVIEKSRCPQIWSVLERVHGVAGPEFIRRLVNEDYNTLRNRYQELRDEEDARAAQNVQGAAYSRQTANLALLRLTYELALRYDVLPQNTKDPSDEARQHIQAMKQDDDQAQKAIEDLLNWAAANPQRFAGHEDDAACGSLLPDRVPSQGYVGLYRNPRKGKPGMYCLIPATLDELLRTLGYEPDIVRPIWSNRDWVVKDGQGKSSFTASIDGRKCRVIGITYEIPGEGDAVQAAPHLYEERVLAGVEAATELPGEPGVDDESEEL